MKLIGQVSAELLFPILFNPQTTCGAINQSVFLLVVGGRTAWLNYMQLDSLGTLSQSHQSVRRMIVDGLEI